MSAEAPDLEAFGRWYDARRRRKTGKPPSPNTLRTKKVQVSSASRCFQRSLPLLAEALGDRQKTEALLDWLALQMSSGAARAVVYALKDYGACCEALGVIEQCKLLDSDVPPPNPKKAITVYTQDEMDRFCEAAWGKDLRWGCFINFLAHTGRRVGETLKIRFDDIHTDADPPYVEMPETKTGPQYAPLDRFLVDKVFTPQTLDKLRRGLGGGRTDFRRDMTVYPFPWAYNTVNNRLLSFCRTLGIDSRGFHNFRHTVITDRLAKGWPLQAVAALAGHSSTQTTEQVYGHTNALSFAHLLDPEEK